MSVTRFRQITFMILLALLMAAPQIAKAASPKEDPAAKLFAYDRKVEFDLKETSTKVESGVVIRDVNYAAYSSRHGRVNAYIVKPQGKGPFAGVVFFHWLGRATSDRTQFLNEAMDLAGHGVVSILFQGYFPWLQPPTEAKADRQHVIDQTIEARRALDLLLMQPEVDAKRIGYVGHDYGAMYGSILAGLDKRVKTYVLVAGMGNFGDWSLKYWPATAAKGAAAYRQVMKEVDPIEYISRAKPARLLFQFASRDIYISKTVADEFFAAASEPKQVKWYDSEHDLDLESVRTDRREWLTRHLGLSPRPLGKENSKETESAQSSAVEQKILELEEASRQATLKNDAVALDQLLADSWMNTNATGTVTTKAQLMEILKSSPFKFVSIENDDVRVRVYGDTAVVTGRSKSVRIRDNAEVTGQVRFTRVYAKQQGRWQVVAAQSTPITQQ